MIIIQIAADTILIKDLLLILLSLPHLVLYFLND